MGAVEPAVLHLLDVLERFTKEMSGNRTFLLCALPAGRRAPRRDNTYSGSQKYRAARRGSSLFLHSKCGTDAIGEISMV